jgi:FAD/FMN-containing dehydrogenase
MGVDEREPHGAMQFLPTTHRTAPFGGSLATNGSGPFRQWGATGG